TEISRDRPSERSAPGPSTLWSCRSGPDSPTPWVPPSTGAAPTSPSSPRSPIGSSCACSTTTAPSGAWRSPRSTPTCGTCTCPRCSPGSATAIACTAPTTHLPATAATPRSCCWIPTRRRSPMASNHPSLYAYEFAEPQERNSGDPAAHTMHSVVVSPFFDWGNDHPPAHEYHDTVIYEAHIKGLTMLHPDIDDSIRGTYVAMGHPAIIEHLQSLGVTAVELMPVHQFVQ